MTYYRIKLDDSRFSGREGEMSIEDAREIAVHLLLNANKWNDIAMIFVDTALSPRYYVFIEGKARYQKFTDYFAHGYNVAIKDTKIKKTYRLNFDGTINRHDRRA